MLLRAALALAFVLPTATASAQLAPDGWSSDESLFSDLTVQDFQSLTPGYWSSYTEAAPLIVDDLAYWGTLWPATDWCIPSMDSSPPCGGSNIYLASAVDLHVDPLVPIDRVAFRYASQGSDFWVDVALSDGTTRTFQLQSTDYNAWGSLVPVTGFFGYGTGDPALTIEHVWLYAADGGIDDVRYGVVATSGACDDLEAAVRALALAKGTENSLLAKVEAADKQEERGNLGAAINVLTALIHELEAQAGKNVPAAAAADLIACVQARIDALSE